MSIGAVDHINLVVSDLTRSLHFYRDLLGFPETKRAVLTGDWIEAVVGLRGVHADVVFVQPPGDGPRLELIQYHAPTGAAFEPNRLPHTLGLRHIAFRVTELDAMQARLSAAGVRFLSPGIAVPGGVVKHDSGHKRLCYFHDPDGVLLELAEYT
jgi:glyoxylase I family protein